MMTKPKISIVVAITSKNAAIGNGGKLLVHISDDLKRFKQITSGHAVIMGRKTYESIGRPLPNRTNIIVTRNAGYLAPGCIVCTSLDEALQRAFEVEQAGAHAPETREVFLVGGGEIYAQGLPSVDRLYLTLVESDLEGDVFFPEYKKHFTKVLKTEDRFDEKTALKYSWIDLER